jgi:hypothetical protein
MVRRHGHEAIAASFGHRSLARQRQRLVGTRKGNPVDDHQRTGRARHVDALPEREGAEQACRLIVDKATCQLRQLSIPLAQDGQLRQLLAYVNRCRFGGASGREQAEGTTSRGPDELGDFSQALVSEALASGCGK